MLGWLHGRLIYDRRIEALADCLAGLLPPGAAVLDVGCGDGRLDRAVLDRRFDLAIEGIDVLVRPDALIPVRAYDGGRLPVADKSADVVTLIDVLHHADEPERLLAEAARAARRLVVVKDHLQDGFLADARLRAMDWVGNARHGVALPYAYWPRARWQEAFARQGLKVEAWRDRLGLYARPLRPMFEDGLHFVAALAPERG